MNFIKRCYKTFSYLHRRLNKILSEHFVFTFKDYDATFYVVIYSSLFIEELMLHLSDI